MSFAFCLQNFFASRIANEIANETRTMIGAFIE